MSDHIEKVEKCQKEEDKFQKNNTDDNFTKRCYEDTGENEDHGERKQTNFANNLKKYSRYDMLLLRNGQLSTHYPHCALRPELQALSIWTCRLRCELQYLGLWKIPNTGNPYGNCSCNGTFQPYTCENGGQSYASSSSLAASAGGSQKYYVNSQQLQQQSQHTGSPSPTLGSKRAVRSRERSLNYQRCINVELIRGTSPGGNCDQPTHHNLSHHAKTPFIDHRSISSSHLMPAFAKRKMSHTNSMHSHVEVCSNFNNNGHNSENLSNDDCGETANHFETSLKSRKESIKNSNNQNDFHLHKTSVNSRQDKNDQFVDGWMMNAVKKINNEYSPSNNKTSNTLSAFNKKLVYERRIGSGRLVPRDVSWEMRGGKKQIEKENNNVSQNSILEKDKDVITSDEVDKLNNRNSSSSRYTDGQERRLFDRRIINADESNSSAGSNNKRYISSILDERNNFESNYHQQQNFTGQRSMSFRRREYADHRDNYREFRDFREQKESREPRDYRESQRGEHHYHNKDEPEWFSEGPTSQHDTIELRGFEESDESNQQILINKYCKVERKNSESSLLSHNSSSNNNLSTKESADISVEISNTSSNNAITSNFDNNGNCNNIVNTKETTPKDTLRPSSDAVVFIADTEENHSKPKQLTEEDNRQPNVAELFFDNFLNIEALENSLIGNVNDQTISNNDLSVGGTSRFSRWFFNNTNNQNNSDELNNNPPPKDDSQRLSKDLNESEFNSIMTFLKCNNIPTPELPKSLPSNVSALSVKELEARMRKMDTGEKKSENNNESDVAQMKISEHERTFPPQAVDINSQDVEAFRKLLDQLGKPRVDISMNIILPNTSGHSLPLTNSVSVMSPSMTALPPNNAIVQSSIAKQDYVMKLMHQQHVQQHQQQHQHFLHQQQNVGKMVGPHVHHQRLTQMSPHQQSSESLSLMPVPYHHHLMPMILGQPQKRNDVQHLYQSVVRDELSRGFLEKELKNPNCPPYAKEIISTVLKETSRLNAPSGSQTNLPTSASIETPIPANEHTNAPSNLMQSLARGEVSLNHLEHELNKLNNIGMISEDSSNSGILKDRSQCVTPSTVSLNTAPITTSASVMQLPPTSKVVLAQQSSIITGENVATMSSEQQQVISSMIRSHHNDDPSMHIPTQRELQMHTQAIMQNAIFKKKLEVEQHEQRRRQEMHKQHELESSSQQHQQQLNASVTQQVQHSSNHINSPTPLAFTPTSVLRKMTAEKESTSNSSQTTTICSPSSQHIQQHTQQANMKLKPHQQINNQHSTYQHPNQPRMILGGGNFQYMHQQHHHILPTANGSPQISPQQKAQIRNQPPVPLKWPLITHTSMDSNQSLLSNISNKPMGRPILKGPGPIVAQTNPNSQCQNQSSVNQNSQSMQTINQMQNYPSIQHHQQQPRQIVGQQFSTHMLQHQIPSSQQNSMQYQQLYQQQRSVVMHRNQIQQNDLGNHGTLPLPSAHHAINNENSSVTNLNYQRDGGLSPTSNQLAQWFSPELLAQASAGKLPLLNMNQALSLEEFERSIQHSSTAVHN